MNIVSNENVFDGKHESTEGIIRFMSRTDFNDKEVIDIGCGNGILTLYAAELGAKHITAIDFDRRAVENTEENLKRNNVKNADVLWADFMETHLKADIIIANLPRETAKFCMPKMKDSLNDKGCIITSWLNTMPESDLTYGMQIIDRTVGKDYDCYVIC